MKPFTVDELVLSRKPKCLTTLLPNKVLVLTAPFEDVTLDAIDAAHSWVNRDGAPRDECFMSTRADTYTYGRGAGVRTYDPIPYTPLVEEIRQRVCKLTAVDYEACFSNKYVDAHKHLGWHADDSDSIDHSYGIAVLSFGAEREIWFRENPVDTHAFPSEYSKEPAPVIRQQMPHGSMVVMPPGFQQTHQHRIPKHSSMCGPRISLTFRKLR